VLDLPFGVLGLISANSPQWQFDIIKSMPKPSRDLIDAILVPDENRET
jgi:hypothetical protein